MGVYSLAVPVLAFLVFWFLNSTFFASSFPPPAELCNKRILLLIGHPDDEAMFFAPSLIALISPQNGNQVKIVCLSTGNAIGEGEIRKGELLSSARRLGIRHDEDVYIVDDPRFQDGPGHWKKEDIAEFLARWYSFDATTNSATSTSSSFPSSQEAPMLRQQQQEQQTCRAVSTSGTTTEPTPSAAPEIIVTFDRYGISNHPNHCACYYGAAHFLHLLNRSNPHSSPKIIMYTLTTTPLLRKYISVLDAPITIITNLLTSKLQRSTTHGERENGRNETASGDSVVFLSGFRDYARAFGAMVYAHKTQMLWFRWGWILTGRYMVVNDLKKERIAG